MNKWERLKELLERIKQEQLKSFNVTLYNTEYFNCVSVLNLMKSLEEKESWESMEEAGY